MFHDITTIVRGIFKVRSCFDNITSTFFNHRGQHCGVCTMKKKKITFWKINSSIRIMTYDTLFIRGYTRLR